MNTHKKSLKYSNLNQVHTPGRKYELSDSQKVQRYNNHKRTSTNWKILINSQVNKIYTQLPDQSYHNRYHHKNHSEVEIEKPKDIYQRFRQIMATSQVHCGDKQQLRQTTVEEHSSYQQSIPDYEEYKQNKVQQCQRKIIQLIYRNLQLKKAIFQLKQSIYEKLQLNNF